MAKTVQVPKPPVVVTGGLVKYTAGCDDCDWVVEARNGMGLAAIHARKNSHHTWFESGHSFRIAPGVQG
jgi:hypothetical protein